MNIRRPRDGFEIRLSERARLYLQSEFAERPIVERHWNSIVERLKVTAHKEGEGIEGLSGVRIMKIAREDYYENPGFVFTYRVLGAVVDVFSVEVGLAERDGDL